MRTGIYVQKPTTITIRASAPADALVQLLRFRVAVCEADARAHLRAPAAVGTHQLDAGIYLIVSSSSMQIAGDNVTTQIVANDKDPWPEVGVVVVGLVPGATTALVQNFFAVTKGIEIADPPPQLVSPTNPDAADVTDDPDGL